MIGSGDYISRNAAIEAMYKDAEANPNHTFWTSQFEALMDIPAADVVSAGAYEQTAWERDTAIAQLAEIGKAFGETMDDAIEERKFYEFLWNTIQPNEMEQYISMYRAQGVPSDASREES